MATKRSQRIGIWIMAGIMVAGTIGGFIAMMVAPSNASQDQVALEAANQEYSEVYAKWQSEKDAIESTYYDTLSEKYFADFSEYQSKVTTYTSSNITELATEDLKEGDGDVIDESTKFAVYYIGWNPKARVFDQSIEGGKLIAPLSIDGLASASLIEGWIDGLIGMKIGGVREISIPSDLAFGETGSGEDIPPNTSIKFVVMAIPSVEGELPETAPAPEMPEILRKEYLKQYGTIN